MTKRKRRRRVSPNLRFDLKADTVKFGTENRLFSSVNLPVASKLPKKELQNQNYLLVISVSHLQWYDVIIIYFFLFKNELF